MNPVLPQSEAAAQLAHGMFSAPMIVVDRDGRVICENDAMHSLREQCDQVVWHRLRRDLELHIAISEVLSGYLPRFHSKVEFTILGEVHEFFIQVLPVWTDQGGILGVQIEIDTNGRSWSG